MNFIHQLTKLRYLVKLQAGLEFPDDMIERFVEFYYKVPYIKKGIISRKKGRPIIVSLTTIPSRLNKVWITIESLLRQTQKPDKLFLWLAKDEFQEIEIPQKLKEQQRRGLEIRYCKNLKSYKKFYYTMLEHRNAYILTVDDDSIYSEKLIEEMLFVSSCYPYAIVCNRSHRIRADKNGLFPYLKWIPYENRKNIKIEPSFLNFFTGNGGVLFPTWLLDKEIFNQDIFMEIASTADDAWLNFNAWNSKIKVVNTKTVLGYVIPIYTSSNTGLFLYNTARKNNNWECENDVQIRNILQYLKLNVNEYI